MTSRISSIASECIQFQQLTAEYYCCETNRPASLFHYPDKLSSRIDPETKCFEGELW